MPRITTAACRALAPSASTSPEARPGCSPGKRFLFHDFRHDYGTKLPRSSKNLKLVQKAMNHNSIRSTLRYAHVLDREVAEALETFQESQRKFQPPGLRLGTLILVGAQPPEVTIRHLRARSAAMTS
jgi:hypothetical protein